MATKKLLIWRYYEGALVMILDILESQGYDGKIVVVNEAFARPNKPIHSNKLKYDVISEVPEDWDGDYLICDKIATHGQYKKVVQEIPVERIKTIWHFVSSVSDTTKLGHGCVINAGVITAGHSEIGNHVFVNRGVTIGHHTKIGDFTTINPGCNIGGDTTIGKNCVIGIGAVISNQVNIGNNTVIGAGSVVIKTIPENVVAYGNPCKVVRKR